LSDQSNIQSDVPTEEHKCGFSEDYPVMGFLQLCADRRFHRCLQERFKEDAGLGSSLEYWIHADAGGTPRMAELIAAPDYCYFKKGVKVMGWSAHGNGCGGFPDTDDDKIREALEKTAKEKVAAYPKASHFVYFATMIRDKDTDEAVVFSTKYEKTAE
jgi:hypothetical protein